MRLSPCSLSAQQLASLVHFSVDEVTDLLASTDTSLEKQTTAALSSLESTLLSCERIGPILLLNFEFSSKGLTLKHCFKLVMKF